MSVLRFVAARSPRRRSVTAIIVMAALLTAAAPAAGAVQRANPAQAAGALAPGHGAHSRADHHDTSGPLRDVGAAAVIDRSLKKKRDLGEVPIVADPFVADGITQAAAGTASTAASVASWDGIGVGFVGPQGNYSVRWAPPDTAGAVGLAHYVQIVNTDFAIFSKSGDVVYGPAPTNTLFAGFGGDKPHACATTNDGDGTVEYDSLADRWVISQFSRGGPPYYECIAISANNDPLGAYYRYAFVYNDFPDYPKLGVWPDAYYITFNLFRTGFVGGLACAYDRARMLQGGDANQLCFNLGTSYGSLLPADVDGPTRPPQGSPGYVVNYGSSRLNLWRFQVNWADPLNPSGQLTGPTAIGVAPFTGTCGLQGWTCVPQPGTTQRLDSLGDRLMYRLAYRNFGDHESLVVDHSVATGSGTGSGIRWYEVRNPRTTPTLFQQGTYAPDATYRWMGSAAMDGSGNLAVAYSTSSSTVRPGLRWAGRLAGDPAGQLTQGEQVLITGTGSQVGGLSRWGDYTALSVDPADDCTFWFVGQYLKADGNWNWTTRISAFRFPSCTGAPIPDYALAVSPASVSVSPGGNASYQVTVSPAGGFADNVTLSVDGLPSGASATFTPTSRSGTASWSAALAVTTTSATPPGTYPLTVKGTSGTKVRSATANLVVAAPNLAISISPSSRTIPAGSSTTYTVAITRSGSFADPVTLTLSGLPTGYTRTFSPNPATGASSTLTIRANSTRGTFTFTVTATGGGLTRTATAQIRVTKR
jgi:hypothetical protein